jgi:hypothetical protein
MTGTQILAVLIGLACLAGTALVWSGRLPGPGKALLTPNWAWTALPVVGFVALAYGIDGGGAGPATVVAFPLVIAGFVMLVWQPSWFGPRWWRERDPADLGQEYGPNAALLAVAKPGLGSQGSLAAIEREMAPEQPLAKVKAALVTERHGRPSAAQRRGVVEGWLLLYERGLVFAANALEDKMRESPVIERLPAADLRSASRVRAGTGQSGVRDVKTLVMGRLRVDGAHGSWILETRRPDRLLAELDRRYGVRTHGTPAGAR